MPWVKGLNKKYSTTASMAEMLNSSHIELKPYICPSEMLRPCRWESGTIWQMVPLVGEQEVGGLRLMYGGS